MLLLQGACVAIVALYVGARLAQRGDRRRLLGDLALLAAAAWLAEDSVIRAYGFYAYSPRWGLFVDRVPLLIVLIWPVVIHSAWDLARHLAGDGPRLPLWVAALVLADASLIEPVAVRAGLWAWTEPGLFAVPPIGLLGWAIFAGLAVHGGRARGVRRLGGLAGTVAGVHLLLLAAWWGGLRWVSGTIPAPTAVTLAWVVAGALTARALGAGAARRVPPATLLLRAPGAAFFFVLLAVHGAGAPWLVAYAVAFAPPYLALLRRS